MDPALLREREAFKKRALATPRYISFLFRYVYSSTSYCCVATDTAPFGSKLDYFYFTTPPLCLC